MRLCSQCERQCSWYTQPQPPKLSMHGETCVPVLPHWLPVGRGRAPVRKGPQPWRGAGGRGWQEDGEGGRGGREENGGEGEREEGGCVRCEV